jgi:hypothetical protein
MATLAPAPPKYSTCPEKKLLTQAFLDALRRLLEMQERHAVIRKQGTPEIKELEMAMEQALKQRDLAREAYILHVRQHVC